MSKITPLFPLSLEELKSNPAIVEYWPHIARPMTGYLLTLLHNGALTGKEANTAEHAVGANYAIGKIIEHFSQLGGPVKEQPRAPRIAPLHRFSEQSAGDITKPNTPEQ